MEFVEIVIDGPILVDRDDIEEGLNEALVGHGEVTGAGTSEAGSHLDVDIEPGSNRSLILERIFGVLETLSVGDSVRVRPGDGNDWVRPSEWRGEYGR
ncbi:hypothetical protein [Micromonospora haikouensis]|uniref:hypothetical protein n=1 Tax=Micromonospora haikouensis TaxID=686309 RepID=UPI000B84A8CB|nr:hypothetical protein [Micromonospora haikouensis]